MGHINHECPHCGAHTAAFEIVSAHPARGSDSTAAVYLRCNSCDYPATAILVTVPAAIALPISSFGKANTNPVGSGWEVHLFFPAPKRPDIPKHLPEPVWRALLGAEKARNIEPYETAAGMYGKALEAAFQILAQAEGRTLYARIESMGKNGRLPQSLVEHLHDLRYVRNWAAHDLDPFTMQEMEEFGQATKLVLTYLFTLPRQLEILRGRDSD